MILLQGDEPLLDPKYIDEVATNIISMPKRLAWNITGPIDQDTIRPAFFCEVCRSK